VGEGVQRKRRHHRERSLTREKKTTPIGNEPKRRGNIRKKLKRNGGGE